MRNLFIRQKTILKKLEATEQALSEAKKEIKDLEAQKEKEKEEAKQQNAKYNVQKIRQNKLSQPLLDEEKQIVIDFLAELNWEDNYYFTFEPADNFPKQLHSVAKFINEKTELYSKVVYGNQLQVSTTKNPNRYFSDYFLGGQF